ncbi:MAG: class II aldolase/adducin family protein [Thermomicrobiales bacterium]|nr:class II aldolase/adducin family protein [Thermomicrobiales bacterium]
MGSGIKQDLLDVCRLVYDRGLTNAAGSNFSTRASETTVYLTPTGNAKRNRLRMTADDLLLVDFGDRILDGQGNLSRSWPTHKAIYLAFPAIGAVIHAHPKWATGFACRPEPMPPLLDAMKKYGDISVVPRDLAVDSPPFAEHIVDVFRERGDSFTKYGHAVLYPFHGVLVAAPDLDDAYDLLERIEFNAMALLTATILEQR